MDSAVIFDADDTLWKTELIYDRVLDRIQLEVENQGIDGKTWRDLQRQIDIKAVDIMGFSAERFPSSSVEAYRLLAKHHNATFAKSLYEMSQDVFATKAELVPGIHDVLEGLISSHKLAVITKGVLSLQHRRIADSGLAPYFHTIAIVQHKSVATFLSACNLLEIEPKNTTSVGNSLKSDIIPAMRAGLSGVWIDSHVWEYERLESPAMPKGSIQLEDITQLPDILSSGDTVETL